MDDGLRGALRGAWAWLRGEAILSKLTCLVVLAGVARIALAPAHVQHDVAMYLQTGQFLIQGQRPYVDFIDLNPPLVMYLSALPAAIARALQTHVVPTALFLTAGAAALSLAFTRRSLLAAFRDAGSEASVAEAVILGLSCAWFWMDLPELLDASFPGHAPPDPRLAMFFGQREHLFVIASAPYLALRFQRIGRALVDPAAGAEVGTRGAVASGIVASLGACLKPPFAMVLLAPELAIAVARRRIVKPWAPEVLALVATALLYLGHFALLPEAVRSAWFGRFLPFLVERYGVFDEPSLAVLVARVWPAALALLAAFSLGSSADGTEKRLVRALALMAGAGAVLYVVQRKGWEYHAIPERTAALAAILGAVAASRVVGARGDADAELARRPRFVVPLSRAAMGRALGLLSVLGGVVVTVCLVRVDTARDLEALRRRSPIQRTLAALTDPKDAVLVATTSVWDPYPSLTLLSRAPGSRYLWLFPIPMLEKRVAGARELEAQFVSELAEDLRARRPRVILLQRGRCFGCAHGTSVDGFFRGHPELATALSEYQSRGVLHDGQDLEVLVRDPPP